MYIFSTKKIGDRGKEVEAIQMNLPCFTYEDPIKPDGIFGDKTKQAVMMFQRIMGLDIDGIVGETTGRALGIWRNSEKGFDISHYNNVTWEKVTEDMKFVNIKATEGMTYTDPNFYKNIEGAESIGLDIGAYHFTKFANEPILEASNFLNTINGLNIENVFLDLEHRSSGKSGKEIFNWTERFLKTLTCDFNINQIGIYTSRNVLNELGMQKYTKLRKYKLWASNWNEQPLVLPFIGWHMWQYSNTGKVDWCDGNLDLNIRQFT
jgi:GH25 family lysozyme M1 (1,4-beta-N-acetylmuramidase)